MKKKLPVVTVAQVEEADRLAGLPLEATVALAEVAGALKDGLLAFASATGLVVMRQMMEAELTGAIGEKHAKIGAHERVGNWHGNAKGSVVLGGRQVTTERPRGRSTAGTRSSSTPGRRSARPICSTPSSSSACWPGWPPGATPTWPSRSEPSSRSAPSRCPSRPSRGASWRPRPRPWAS